MPFIRLLAQTVFSRLAGQYDVLKKFNFTPFILKAYAGI